MASKLLSPAFPELLWWDYTGTGVEGLRTASRGLSSEMGGFKGKNSPG